MKILHFITSLRTGGAEHLLVDLLPRLKERGDEVSVLVLDGTRTHFSEVLEKSGIRVDSFGTGIAAMHNPLMSFKLIQYIKNNRFDIIHSHNTPCQLLSAFSTYFSNAIFVTTEHNTFNRRRNWRWYRRIDNWMYGRFRRIICVNSETKNSLIQAVDNFRIAEKTCKVNNGIDISRFQHVPASVLPAGCKNIIMVSAFRKQKDQKTLIKAICHLPDDYRLMLAGEGELKRECELLSSELGLEKRVSFPGIRSDVPALLASSDVIVMSSHYEGLSLSSIEGMASGKPFIASNVDGLREIVDGAGLLFEEGNDIMLAELIKKVCEDKIFAERIGQRCRERAGHYDISATVEGYGKVYESLIKENI